jgi:diguanylate cyclase (GGDEF)-like protein
VIVAGCVGLFVLVLLRVAGLVREVEAKVAELHGTEAVLRASLSERDTLAGQLHHQAFHDSLTGLANRALFRERLDRAIDEAAGGPGQVTVMLIDLDDFKLVNDTLGHAAGDELLVEVAGRLDDCLQDSGTVARLGGDEFAVVLTGERAPSVVAAQLLASLDAPCTVAGRQVAVRASVGVAELRADDQVDAAGLMRNADVAMYAAKGRGKHTYEVFQPWMVESVLGGAMAGERVAVDP